MSLLAWVVVGLVAGGIARFVVKNDRSGCLYTMAVGVLGALIGGALMQAAGSTGIDEFDFRTVLVAALGSILLLLVLDAIGGRRKSRR
jgi:uncharacterized membrane protein YeaQ/YmgE (transglycosylase-associated protein family)